MLYEEVINMEGRLFQVRYIGKGCCDEGCKKGVLWTEVIGKNLALVPMQNYSTVNDAEEGLN